MDEKVLFSKFLDGEITKEERKTMEEAFAGHPEIRREWERWLEMDAFLRSMPLESPPAGFADSVLGRLPTMSPWTIPLWWGLAWTGGVFLSGILLTGVITWYLAYHPAWIDLTIDLALSGIQVVQVAFRVWMVWAGAIAVVLQGFAVPLAFAAVLYTALAVAIVGVIVGRRHWLALRVL